MCSDIDWGKARKDKLLSSAILTPCRREDTWEHNHIYIRLELHFNQSLLVKKKFSFFYISATAVISPTKTRRWLLLHYLRFPVFMKMLTLAISGLLTSMKTAVNKSINCKVGRNKNYLIPTWRVNYFDNDFLCMWTRESETLQQ